MPVPFLRQAIRCRHSAVDEERGGRVIARHMHGPLRLTYALLANDMAKCQMSSGPCGPIFIISNGLAILVLLF